MIDKMNITTPDYNKNRFSCHQNKINLYCDVKTIEEANAKIRKFEKNNPKLYCFSTFSEKTIWINSKIDTGERYYSVVISFDVSYLSQILE